MQNKGISCLSKASGFHYSEDFGRYYIVGQAARGKVEAGRAYSKSEDDSPRHKPPLLRDP